MLKTIVNLTPISYILNTKIHPTLTAKNRPPPTISTYNGPVPHSLL